jgi:hypothetical protein
LIDDSICQIRKINCINQETPLLVPSFSSILDEKIGLIHDKVRSRIPSACLVSAYDVVHGYINKDNIWTSDVLVIDSGNYEYNNLCNSIHRKKWCLEDYSAFIQTLKPLSKVIIVNFDEKETLERQIANANRLFQRFSDYAKCFLYRPPSGRLDINEFILNIAEMSKFDVLGLTEKELGCSIIERCQNLIKLRRALKEKNLKTPIHVFGCIDPLGVLIFFLSGADIFDGTNWLKFSFDDNLAIYPNNSAVISGVWNYSDSSIFEYLCAENLRKLTNLMFDLRNYACEHDFKTLSIKPKLLKNVMNIIAAAQSNVER